MEWILLSSSILSSSVRCDSVMRRLLGQPTIDTGTFPSIDGGFDLSAVDCVRIRRRDTFGLETRLREARYSSVKAYFSNSLRLYTSILRR